MEKMLYLKDEPLIANNTTILKALEKNAIFTVEDALKFDDTKPIVGAKSATKNQIRGIIDLLKYKYINEPLLVLPLLNKSFLRAKANEDVITSIELYRMGLTTDDLNTLGMNYSAYIDDKENSLTVIEYFKIFVQRWPNYRVTIKLNLFIKYYENEMQAETDLLTSKQLADKIQELKILMEKRASIDDKIALLEAQINLLSNNDKELKK